MDRRTEHLKYMMNWSVEHETTEHLGNMLGLLATPHLVPGPVRVHCTGLEPERRKRAVPHSGEVLTPGLLQGASPPGFITMTLN